MKKKLFGTKLKAVFSVLLCLLFAVAFWFLVKYSQLDASALISAIRDSAII